MKPTKCTNFPN